MGEAIGQILPFAVGVALSPISIVGVVLMLGTPRARPNGPAFITGWVLGLAAAGTIGLLATGGADASDHGEPADWVNVLLLVLGVLLVGEGARQWRGRPRGTEEAALPKWMEAIDSFTPAKSGALGVALSALNPKNLLLVIGAAAAIAQTGVSVGGQAVAFAVFVVIATLGTGTPVALYFALGERSKPILDDLRLWMGRNNAAIMAVLCLVIAAKLVGDAVSGLSA